MYYEGKLYSGIAYLKGKKSGNIIVEYSVKDGVLDGYFREWYTRPGQLMEETFFSNGKRNGASKKWYKNGNMKQLMNYKNGLGDGVQREWYENGNMKNELNIKENKLHGVATFWYENGVVAIKTNWRDGDATHKLCWDENEEEVECGEAHNKLLGEMKR